MTINGRNIDIPADMQVRDDGMFDYIEYRGIEIRMFDESNDFAVALDRDSDRAVIVATLDDARKLIDSK